MSTQIPNQASTATIEDRLPILFDFLLKYYQLYFLGAHGKSEIGDQQFNILSFGCSSGEEPHTLVTKYFQDERVHCYAADINEDALKSAKTNRQHRRISYFNSSIAPIHEHGPYNIIVCSSVLCRWPETKGLRNILNIYSFEQFNNSVKELDATLKDGGVLLISNASYRFIDTDVSSKYASILINGYNTSGFVHKYGKDSCIQSDQFYPYVIFLKLTGQ